MTKRKKSSFTGQSTNSLRPWTGLLKDRKSTNETMGGIPVMLCGDFRQILPMIRSDTRANIMNKCTRKVYFWKDVKHLKLTTNMCSSAW